MAETGELDFSSIDGMDDIDWSDVEEELQQNRTMLNEEAAERKGEAAAAPAADAPVVGKQSPPPQEAAEINDIDFLLDVPLMMTVEVGTAKMYIKDLLSLNEGSIIELQKRIGTPLNVLISDKLVAKGEIVVQNEKFGLKLTEILDKNERLKKLKR